MLGNFRQKRVIRYIVTADGEVFLANVTDNIVVIIHEKLQSSCLFKLSCFFPVCCSHRQIHKFVYGCSLIALCVDTQIIQHIETVYPDCALFHPFHQKSAIVNDITNDIHTLVG